MRAWAVALVLVACPRVPAVDQRALEVSGLTLAFPREEEGDLFFELSVPDAALRVISLRWALSIEGRPFAAGVVLAPQVVTVARGKAVRIDAPLVVRHLEWREGTRLLDVRLSGDVELRDESSRVPFSTAQRLSVDGAPRFDAATTRNP